MGPKTAEALRAHGVKTLGALAALTAPQQEELLASVPRTIVGQLKRMGGLEAMVDRANNARKKLARGAESLRFREHETRFRRTHKVKKCTTWWETLKKCPFGTGCKKRVLKGVLRKKMQ